MPSNQKPKKPIVDERPEPGERGARRTIILICAVLVISAHWEAAVPTVMMSLSR